MNLVDVDGYQDQLTSDYDEGCAALVMALQALVARLMTEIAADIKQQSITFGSAALALMRGEILALSSDVNKLLADALIAYGSHYMIMSAGRIACDLALLVILGYVEYELEMKRQELM